MEIRFVAKRGDALAEKALSVLIEAGCSTGWRGDLSLDSKEIKVTLLSSPICQKTAVTLAVYRVKKWQKLGMGPLLIFLTEGAGNDFRSSVLDAARRYLRWNPHAGQLAPFTVSYRSMDAKNRSRFEHWLKEAGEFAGVPKETINRLVKNLRRSLPKEKIGRRVV